MFSQPSLHKSFAMAAYPISSPQLYAPPLTLAQTIPYPTTLFPIDNSLATLPASSILTATSRHLLIATDLSTPSFTSPHSLTTTKPHSANPTPTTPAPLKPHTHTLKPYQIFLIIFFGLASIPISILILYITRTLTRPRDFSHDEEWSSSRWKRSTRTSTLPKRSLRGLLVPRHCSSSLRTSDIDLGCVAQVRSEPHPGVPAVLRETELGRAWGRPRRVEDEGDEVFVIPVPPAVPRDAEGRPARTRTRDSVFPLVVLGGGGGKGKKKRHSREISWSALAFGGPGRATHRDALEREQVGRLGGAAVVEAERGLGISASRVGVDSQPPAQAQHADRPRQRFASASAVVDDAQQRLRRMGDGRVKLPARPLSTAGLLETLERARKQSMDVRGDGGTPEDKPPKRVNVDGGEL